MKIVTIILMLSDELDLSIWKKDFFCFQRAILQVYSLSLKKSSLRTNFKANVIAWNHS